MKKQLFISSDGLKPTKSLMNPVKNWMMNKPHGGFWTSTFINRKLFSAWYLWCKRQEFRLQDTDTYWLLTPSKEAKIYTIDGWEDLMRLADKYPFSMYDDLIQDADYPRSFKEKEVNFEKAASEYDAIHVTYKAASDLHLKLYSYSKDDPWEDYRDLNTWDCESTVWLKWRFDKVEKLVL